ncbi:rod shape-determining protein MreD [Yoonia sp.]|uniref:rod shape-determining protein MreD n=1 Tax=Yoonia sp. TaxID=2212373 RepID=UPI0019E5FDD4|nr:rod shape-determining protein MreD [Yoonia sp.]MBE0413598.1 rod shape-determining protein MreD [Yoonia sp.]
MAEAVSASTWAKRLIFLALAFLIIIMQLVPLDMRPPRWAAPDLLLAFTLAWVARRPDCLPVAVVAGIFLLADLLFQRPPGLWAALVVILSETLRRRSREFRNMPLLLEWGTIAFGIVAITLANRVVLAIVMTPQAPLGLTLSQMVLTIAIYPLVVFVNHSLLGVRRLAPGAVDGKGHRL